jgi:hypothetical protein
VLAVPALPLLLVLADDEPRAEPPDDVFPLLPVLDPEDVAPDPEWLAPPRLEPAVLDEPTSPPVPSSGPCEPAPPHAAAASPRASTAPRDSALNARRNE